MTNNTFYKQVGQHKTLKSDEQRKLLEDYRVNGNMEARDILIETNMKLGMKIAKKYANNGLEYEDLCQEAFIGLINAIEKFDLSKEFHLSTYAYYVINQSVKTALQDKKNTIRVPQWITNNLYKVRNFLDENPKAGKDEVMKEFSFTEKTTVAMLQQLQEIVNIDKVEVEDLDAGFKDVDYDDMVDQLYFALNNELSPQHRDVLLARMGLSGTGKPMTLAQAGQFASVEAGSVRQYEQEAMSVLKDLDYLKIYVKGE